MDIRICFLLGLVLVGIGTIPALADSQEWATAGTYSWTVPDGVSSITATIVGGGGGGKGGYTNQNGGGGGGFAGTIRTEVMISVTSGDSISIVVGSGGEGGAGSQTTPGSGNSGQASSVGIESASGGSGATSGSTVVNGAAGANGYGSGSYASAGVRGTGAVSYGAGGAGGTGYGAGGGGGGAGGTFPPSGSGTGGNGGTGAMGYVSITYTVSASPPVASFTVNQTTGMIPFSVQFTDTSTNSPTSWSWTFGDQTTSTLQNPVHTYSSAGVYSVTLNATNSGGSNLSDTTTITVMTPTTQPTTQPTTVPPTPTPAPSADTWYTTPGTYTWTCPAGVHYVNVTMAAGGGGGAAGSGSEYGWGGYAGQYRDVKRVKVTPGETYTIRVGAGGASGQWGQQSQFGPITAIQGAPGPGTLAESTSSGENGRNDTVSLASAGSSGGSGGIGYGAGGGGGGLSSPGGTGGSGMVALEYGYTMLGFPYDRTYAYNGIDLLDQANYLSLIGLFGAIDTGRALEDGPAGEDVDWSKIIGISLNPFETHLGAHLAMVIIFSIPFIMQWLMQGNSIVPAVSGMVLGILIITLLPADYYLVAVTFIALSILAVIYSLLKERM